jgi:hypothetical protein
MKSLLEAITDTSEHLHKEVGLMFLVKAQSTKALSEDTRCKFQT